MTAEEYLSTLQTLAREFAHSEPVPKQNDTWADTLEKMLPQELRKEVYAVS